ncbi:hypothetical protein Ait01nite_032110 [Actinoplanes italicus]|uniref:Uncharacterized protein n=1 Tax=Actinoplanes italicus TaxID=113567 RepID=A0A2T0KJH3_9ACTN|nr:hypothetical protein [Actinoplanes italicus]PRX23664.1 hypothetical protein CLV67_103413 [Actinoplanes italicus]GIE30166.1 hypothetical protein Ait01nite_032110 [Actinoplanes italicus]
MGVSTNRNHPETSEAGQKAKDDAVNADRSTAEVQAKVDEDQARGFRGVEVDPTPNENYTIAGVTSGAPTPETDDAAAETARKAQVTAANTAAGVAKR